MHVDRADHDFGGAALLSATRVPSADDLSKPGVSLVVIQVSPDGYPTFDLAWRLPVPA